jgi:hypothetical protein
VGSTLGGFQALDNLLTRRKPILSAKRLVIVVQNVSARALIGLEPTLKRVALSGIADKAVVYEIS